MPPASLASHAHRFLRTAPRWPDAQTRLAPAVLLYSPPLYGGVAALPHSPEEKKKVLARIRRIRGQCEGLERALEAGADCGPVLQQIAAIRGAVNGLMREERESELRDEYGQAAHSGAEGAG